MEDGQIGNDGGCLMGTGERHLEWQVELEGGETASHTDMLAIARNDRGLCQRAKVFLGWCIGDPRFLEVTLPSAVRPAAR